MVITIVGTNDGPEIGSGPQAGNVAEDGNTFASGQVIATDADDDAVLAYSVDDGGAGAHGTLVLDATTGAWTYDLDNGSTAVQPTGSSPSHATTPGEPASTWACSSFAFCARSVPSQSARLSLNHWHQHPAGSPFVPNTVLSASHVEASTERVTTSSVMPRTYRGPPTFSPIARGEARGDGHPAFASCCTR